MLSNMASTQHKRQKSRQRETINKRLTDWVQKNGGNVTFKYANVPRPKPDRTAVKTDRLLEKDAEKNHLAH